MEDPPDVAELLWRDRSLLVKTWAQRGTLHLHRTDELPLWVGAQAALKPALRAASLAAPFRAHAGEDVEAILDGGARRAARRAAHPRGAGRASARRASRAATATCSSRVAFRGELIFARGRRRFALPEPFDALATEEPRRRRSPGATSPATARPPARSWRSGSGTRRRRRPASGSPRARWSRRSSGWRWPRTSRRWRRPNRRASCGCCPRSTSTSSPRRATSGRRPRRERIYRPGGWFSPVLLVDGVMAGVWKLERRRGDASSRSARSARPCAAPPRPRRRGFPVSRPPAGAKLRGTPPLVTISASYGAGGSRIGPALAQRLGVEFLDRAIPTRVADRLGCLARRRARPRRVARRRDRPTGVELRAAARAGGGDGPGRRAGRARTTGARPRR